MGVIQTKSHGNWN